MDAHLLCKGISEVFGFVSAQVPRWRIVHAACGTWPLLLRLLVLLFLYRRITCDWSLAKFSGFHVALATLLPLLSLDNVGAEERIVWGTLEPDGSQSRHDHRRDCHIVIYCTAAEHGQSSTHEHHVRAKAAQLRGANQESLSIGQVPAILHAVPSTWQLRESLLLPCSRLSSGNAMHVKYDYDIDQLSNCSQAPRYLVTKRNNRAIQLRRICKIAPHSVIRCKLQDATMPTPLNVPLCSRVAPKSRGKLCNPLNPPPVLGG